MTWISKVSKLKKAVEEEKVVRTTKTVKPACIHGEDDCVRCASEDFDNQEETVWADLAEDDIRRAVVALPEKVRELMRRHPGEVVVAGGFLRAIIANESVHDIDVFISDEGYAKLWVEDMFTGIANKDKHLVPIVAKGELPIQIIWRYPFKEPVEVIEAFDYTVAKAEVWFDPGNKDRKPNFVGLCHERFYRDLARKLLFYDCDRETEWVSAFPRLMKYAHYGYTMDPKSLAEVVVKTCLCMDLTKGFEGMVKQLEDYYVASGTEKEWEAMTKPYVAPKQTRSHDYSYGS